MILSVGALFIKHFALLILYHILMHLPYCKTALKMDYAHSFPFEISLVAYFQSVLLTYFEKYFFLFATW